MFTDVFGKAASAISTKLLESSESFDVTAYLIKGIKAPVEKIQAAVDGEMCAEQAEKIRNPFPHGCLGIVQTEPAIADPDYR